MKKSKTAEVIWTPIAIQDFESIQDYLGKKFGDQSVEKFTGRVFHFLSVLEDHAKIGSIEDKEKNIGGFVLTRQNSILYKRFEHKIYLLAFFDNRQSPESKNKFLEKF